MHGFPAPAGMEPCLLREGRVLGRVRWQVVRLDSASSFQSNTAVSHPRLHLLAVRCWRLLISQATSFPDHANSVGLSWSDFGSRVNKIAMPRWYIQTADPLPFSLTLCAALLELSRLGGAPVP